VVVIRQEAGIIAVGDCGASMQVQLTEEGAGLRRGDALPDDPRSRSWSMTLNLRWGETGDHLGRYTSGVG
jgi:hypothetical protein